MIACNTMVLPRRLGRENDQAKVDVRTCHNCDCGFIRTINERVLSDNPNNVEHHITIHPTDLSNRATNVGYNLMWLGQLPRLWPLRDPTHGQLTSGDSLDLDKCTFHLLMLLE